jgi:hypothetical protein
MCGLMLQIVETRVLSVIAIYYIAFFAIGVAMLGMTAGALLVFARAKPSYELRELNALLSKIMTAFAWTVLVSLVLLLSLAIGGADPRTLASGVGWLVTMAVLLPPYVLLGAAVSLALTRSGQRISLVYGVDLIGAASGCLVALALLWLADSYTAVLLVGAIGAIAGLAFRRAALAAEGSAGRVFGLAGPNLALVVVTLVASLNIALGARGLRPVIVKSGIEHAETLAEERWNSFSRITLEMHPHTEAFMFSPSAVAPHVVTDWGYMTIDGSAGTPTYRYGGDPAQVDFLRYDATALAYYIRHSGRAAVIGVGGGRDVLTASLFGFRDITGVEYNPIFVRLLTRDRRAFNGSDRIPGLKVYTDDARSWFARSQQRFDLIQMSLIDTWAATGAGAFTLSESGLYTVEGWKRFMARLTPTGVLTVSRWYSPYDGDETARILSLAMATLIEAGATNPRDHIYLAGNRNLSTIIVGKSELSANDLSTLDHTTGALKYSILAAPGHAAASPTFERILSATTTRDLIDAGARSPLNLAPTWDANPFFFNQLRLTDLSSLARASRAVNGVIYGNLLATITLIELVTISALVLMFVLIFPTREIVREVPSRVTAWCSAYFLAIGLGFMFVEMALIQRMSIFMGHPVLGLAVVLFSIILATGVGSLVSEKAMSLTLPAMVGWPLALAAYLASAPLWLGPVLVATESGPLLVRACVCLAVVAPGGILMGFMFPTGLRLCNIVEPKLAPWLWAVNGAAGVLASGLAVLVSIQTSLNVALWVGAGAYAALAGIAVRILGLAPFAEKQSATT